MTQPVHLDLERLAKVLAEKATAGRIVVAIAGAPGSGKSTLAEALASRLHDTLGVPSQILPMDGFHYDNAVLEPWGLLPRKGAPETFDVAGLATALASLRHSPPRNLAVPVFDREHDLARAGARILQAETRIILVEGNYLLLEQAPWTGLRPDFDVTVSLPCDMAVLRERLIKRWRDHGYGAEDARAKAEGNDLPNATLVTTQSAPADFVLTPG